MNPTVLVKYVVVTEGSCTTRLTVAECRQIAEEKGVKFHERYSGGTPMGCLDGRDIPSDKTISYNTKFGTTPCQQTRKCLCRAPEGKKTDFIL